MPLVQTRGAASAQGFGEFAQSTAVNYIEEVFSTYLYTGTGAALTITNGIDLSTKGGLVWIKDRVATPPHLLIDTVRGGNKFVSSNTSLAQTTTSIISAFNTTGFSLTADTVVGDWNWSGDTFASWTFRKQPKFFDVVTYTGTGSNTTISHSLGSVPACIWVKRTDTTGDWQVYHRSLANTEYLVLNSDAAKATGATRWNSTTPTSTVFSLGTDATVNASGGTYVAYLFAHDAGGFGLTGTDNVISCGSYTGNGSLTGPVITLGYEPQLVLVKRSSGIREWFILDTMRGLTTDGNINGLQPQSSAAEFSAGSFLAPTSTGFELKTSSADMNGSGSTYIYIAIRRGPMKVPTSGASVFDTQTYTGTGADQTLTTGFPVSQYIIYNKAGGSGIYAWFDRLRGQIPFLNSTSTAVETTSFTTAEMPKQDSNTGITLQGVYFNSSGQNRGIWAFQRAPSVFDVVCYTGTGSNTTVSHNLTVVPEMIIVKNRSAVGDWRVYTATGGNTNGLKLNGGAGYDNDSTLWNSTSPTSSVFSIGTNSNVNTSGNNYVAYLFATCAGVSKVGSYTGTGTTIQVNCGFTSGARFVMIKRADGTGSWYVWDTARGIVSGNDPYLRFNSTDPEVTNEDLLDPYSAGFEVSTGISQLNGSGNTYIFLAIA